MARALLTGCLLNVLFFSISHAQMYFTGPYGPGGTWNLYEHSYFVGAARFENGGSAKTWIDAHNEATSKTESISGRNERGHLVAFSGASASDENRFVASRAFGGAWMGLTDHESFGGGESGANGTAGLGNPPGDGMGWKWTSEEVFNYANWGFGEPRPDNDFGGDATFMLRGSTWSTRGGVTTESSLPAPYVIEFETRNPSDFAVPQLPAPRLIPGPEVVPGAFAVREVLWTDTNGDLNKAIGEMLNASSRPVVYDYYTQVIDARDYHVMRPPTAEDRFEHDRPFEVHAREAAPFAGGSGVAMVAHAKIQIPEGQGGDWTFHVNSDDGFELWLPGARFNLVSHPTSGGVTHYGSLSFPVVRAEEDTLGTVSLASGVYDLEFVYFDQNGIGSVELSAARGVKASFDNDFVRVGAPALTVRGVTPTVDPFVIKQVTRQSNAPGPLPPAEQINSVSDAKALIAEPDANDPQSTAMSEVVNLSVGTNSRFQDIGRFTGDSPRIERASTAADTAFQGTTVLHVTTPGTYTFGFDTVDGAELTILGGNFTKAIGTGTLANNGQSLLVDSTDGPGLSLGSIDLAAGDYPLEFLTFNRDGDAFAELFVAPGAAEFFDARAFRLLSTTAISIDYTSPAGIQLVPEPDGVILACFAILLSILTAIRGRGGKT
jgi:hypothetical protein